MKGEHEVHEDTKEHEVKSSKWQLAEELEALGKKALNAVFNVHSILGSGLLESVYEDCLEIELCSMGLHVDRQIAFPIRYKGHLLEKTLRIDLVVERSVILELKSVESLTSVHEAQILSYLKLSGIRLGYLINYGDPYLKRGIKRFVN